MMIREMPREEFDKLWPFELDDLEKVVEKCGVKRTIGEILDDYVRSTALDILPRKIMGEEEIRRVIEYIDSRVKRLEEEINLLKGLKEIIEDKVRRLSVEPSMEEVSAILSSEVRWRSYPSGEGEWCFADELPKSFVEELKKRGVMDLDGYRYVYKRLSGGKGIVARRAR